MKPDWSFFDPASQDAPLVAVQAAPAAGITDLPATLAFDPASPTFTRFGRIDGGTDRGDRQWRADLTALGSH